MPRYDNKTLTTSRNFEKSSNGVIIALASSLMLNCSWNWSEDIYIHKFFFSLITLHLGLSPLFLHFVFIQFNTKCIHTTIALGITLSVCMLCSLRAICIVYLCSIVGRRRILFQIFWHQYDLFYIIKMELLLSQYLKSSLSFWLVSAQFEVEIKKTE